MVISACTMRFLLKMLCSEVLVMFEDYLCLLHFLMNSVYEKDYNGLISSRVVCRSSNSFL